MTFEQFERRLSLVRADIDRATWAHYTTIYIREAGRKSDAVYNELNRHRNFWNYQMDALQCSLFMALGRLFETDHNALTISKFLNESSRNAGTLFSRQALHERKKRAGLTEAQVVAYMRDVTADPSRCFDG